MLQQHGELGGKHSEVSTFHDGARKGSDSLPGLGGLERHVRKSTERLILLVRDVIHDVRKNPSTPDLTIDDVLLWMKRTREKNMQN